MANRSDEDWLALHTELYAAFSPGAPIKLDSELAGRRSEAQRLRNIMLGAGEHALIYGERGVGKTSVALTFWLSLNTPTRPTRAVPVNCGDNDFTAIWRKVFRRLRGVTNGEAVALDQLYPGDITPDDVEIELSNFGLNELPIILLDEFDQISDERTLVQFTELIKSLSDHNIHAKLVLIGIAENAGELIAEHQSLSRALKQVKVQRLSLEELETIVASRYRRFGIQAKGDALFQMAYLSRGLPYYAHLLGRHAGLTAIAQHRTVVTEDDVFTGLKAAVQDVDQTITEAYLQAVLSQRPEETLYEAVLVACALADSDDLGRFQQTAVAAPLAEIAIREPPYTASTFAFHMNEFCEEKRGWTLQRSGETRNYRYVFRDAMMQPYVIIRALETGKLKRETFDRFIARRQRRLSNDF